MGARVDFYVRNGAGSRRPCKLCKRPILLAPIETKQGTRWHPLEIGTRRDGRRAGGGFYESHIAFCPDADHIRKRKRASNRRECLLEACHEWRGRNGLFCSAHYSALPASIRSWLKRTREPFTKRGAFARNGSREAAERELREAVHAARVILARRETTAEQGGLFGDDAEPAADPG